MKSIIFQKSFEKSYTKRIVVNSRLKTAFTKRYDLFISGERGHPINDHALTGSRKSQRSFSISADVRVIYTETKTTIIFLDIGTHNQVYN